MRGLRPAKWIFLPLLVIVIVGAGLILTLDRRACVATCIAAGYEFRGRPACGAPVSLVR